MRALSVTPATLFINVAKQGLGVPILLLVILAMITIPLPPMMLDLLFTFNIVLSLTVLMVCVYARRPLDFSIFPTVILIATLLRLGLNVASTRVILIHGQEGAGSAGHVIESFGQFVIGDNYAVGIVVFIVLVIINFIVITKGAERVSEVNARFTLDSLPGKQMAIDADLNSGFIDQMEASKRRKEIAVEAEFHGSMDGASKFVKGDAIASMAILAVNLIGGLGVGILQHSLSFSQALEFYVTLSLGDGLVAQIPALILSTATAIIITRVSHSDNLTGLVSEQMLSEPKVLAIVAGILTCMGIIPGMPNAVFLSIAAITAGVAFIIDKRRKQEEASRLTTQKIEAATTNETEVTLHDIQRPQPITLEIGYRVINLIRSKEDSNLLNQIRGIRKELSQKMGFLVQTVHICDSMEIQPNQYCIKIRGTTVATGQVMADLLLALNTENNDNKLSGIPTKDPTFGIDAVWIRDGQKAEAEQLGYSVVDSATVVATHLRQTLIENANTLISHNDAHVLIEELKMKSPVLVDEFYPKQLNLSDILKIFRNLLAEQVSIKDLTTICETLAEYAPKEHNTTELTQVVRKSLGRAILQNIVGDTKSIEVFTLDPQLEGILLQGAQQNAFAIEPNLAQKLHANLYQQVQEQIAQGHSAMLLVSPQIRVHLAKFLLPNIKELHILAYDEIPPLYDISVKQQVTAN